MPLVITCPECERRMKVADTAAGKRVKCSACGHVFSAAAPTLNPKPQTKPAAKSPPSDDSDEDARPSRPTRRRRESKKSNTALYVILGVVLCVFLIGGLVIGGIFWLAGKAKDAVNDVAYVPPPSMPPGGGPQPPFVPPQGGQPQQPMVPPAGAPKGGVGSKALAEFDWKPFKEPNGRYVVLMPKTPKQDLPGYYTVAALQLGNVSADVFSYDFSVHFDKRENEDRSVEQQIKDWREANTDADFKPSKDQAIQVKGHAGWEIAYKKPPQKEFVRRWFVKLKDGVALVSVVVPDTPDWIAAADKFFTSFLPGDVPSTAPGTPPQTPASQPADGQVLEMTAEKLGQEDLDKGEPALNDKYQGKRMRISGKVESVLENFVYLGTGLKHKEGQPVKIVMIFADKADAQKLKAGMKVVIEGRYELAGVFGPSFKECRLVKKE